MPARRSQPRIFGFPRLNQPSPRLERLNLFAPHAETVLSTARLASWNCAGRFSSRSVGRRDRASGVTSLNKAAPPCLLRATNLTPPPHPCLDAAIFRPAIGKAHDRPSPGPVPGLRVFPAPPAVSNAVEVFKPSGRCTAIRAPQKLRRCAGSNLLGRDSA